LDFLSKANKVNVRVVWQPLQLSLGYSRLLIGIQTHAYTTTMNGRPLTSIRVACVTTVPLLSVPLAIKGGATDQHLLFLFA